MVNFPPTKMLVFAMILVFLTILVLGVKLSWWGKNLLDEIEIHQAGTSKTVKFVGFNF